MGTLPNQTHPERNGAKAVSRAIDHARQLVTDLQRELERSAPQREADGER